MKPSNDARRVGVVPGVPSVGQHPGDVPAQYAL